MKEDGLLKILFLYMKSHISIMLLFCMYLILFVVIFSLYSIPLEAIIYSSILSALLTAILVVIDFIKYYIKHQELCYIKNYVESSIDGLPVATNLIESDYKEILLKLFNYKNNLALQSDITRTDMIDYFTLWAHQIKSPLAAIRLLIQSDESYKLNNELMIQLSIVEQYVDMVLGYLRIESTSSDLLLKKYNLLDIVKQGIRKYSYFFIHKNIKLEFQELECSVLTDEKWLLFVFEQILFNALKYTHTGSISIIIDSCNKRLIIKDTGIGIAEDDLPRIFEKGFTGYNGRMDKKATGIGLYLSKKIISKLSHTIKIESKVGEGTTVTLDLSLKEKLME